MPLSASDPDRDPLTFSVDADPDEEVLLLPDKNQLTFRTLVPGTQRFTLTAFDGKGGEGTQEVDCIVEDAPNLNTAPALKHIGTIALQGPDSKKISTQNSYRPPTQILIVLSLFHRRICPRVRQSLQLVFSPSPTQHNLTRPGL